MTTGAVVDMTPIANADVQGVRAGEGAGAAPADSSVSASAPTGVRPADVLVLKHGQATAARDWLADETPVALVYNGISHAVMMATPADLEDFALGFSITEGLLSDRSELHGVEIAAVPDGIEVRLQVSAACEWKLRERRRVMSGRTGCGLCGADSLAMVRQPLPRLPEAGVDAQAVSRAMQALRALQPRQQLTGSTHAAALCRRDGAIELVREDVGRHNALDKLIGALLREGRDADSSFIAVTSRASFEMVQKTALAGVPVLAAASAATAMAVDLAIESRMLLIGFVRADSMVAYTFAQRLRQRGADTEANNS